MRLEIQQIKKHIVKTTPAEMILAPKKEFCEKFNFAVPLILRGKTRIKPKQKNFNGGYTMKNSKTILNNVINSLPEKLQPVAMEILTVKILGQNTVYETAEITGYSVSIVIDVLQACKRIGKKYSPSDFLSIA